MVEQLLINALVKLTAKIGGGEIIRDMVREVDVNGNPKVWTVSEMEHALHFINDRIEFFDKQQALKVIDILMNKYEIGKDHLDATPESLPDNIGVQGLQ